VALTERREKQGQYHMSEWISVEDRLIPADIRTLQLFPSGYQGSDRVESYEDRIKATPASDPSE